MVEAQSKEMGAPLDFASETHTKMGADICRNNIEILKDFNFRILSNSLELLTSTRTLIFKLSAIFFK